MITEYTLTGLTDTNLAAVAMQLTLLTTRSDGGRSDMPVSVTVAALPDRTIWSLKKAQRIGTRTVTVTIVH